METRILKFFAVVKPTYLDLKPRFKTTKVCDAHFNDVFFTALKQQNYVESTNDNGTRNSTISR